MSIGSIDVGVIIALLKHVLSGILLANLNSQTLISLRIHVDEE